MVVGAGADSGHSEVGEEGIGEENGLAAAPGGEEEEEGLVAPPVIGRQGSVDAVGPEGKGPSPPPSESRKKTTKPVVGLIPKNRPKGSYF